MTHEQQENLTAEAVQWARSGTGEAQVNCQPALTPEELAAKVTARGRLLMKAQD